MTIGALVDTCFQELTRFNLRYRSTWSNAETTCVLVHVFIALLQHGARGKVNERVRRAGEHA